MYLLFIVQQNPKKPKTKQNKTKQKDSVCMRKIQKKRKNTTLYKRKNKKKDKRQKTKRQRYLCYVMQ